jgi:hypothetical protein
VVGIKGVEFAVIVFGEEQSIVGDGRQGCVHSVIRHVELLGDFCDCARLMFLYCAIDGDGEGRL